MKWKTIGEELGLIVLPLGECLGAFGLNARAWHIGSDAPGLGLMGCYPGCFLLMLGAWLTVFFFIKTAAGKTQATDLTVADVIVLVLTIPGCIGCYPLWPAVLLVPVLLLLAPLSGRKEGRSLDWRLVRRGALIAVLFLLTWYQCAAVKRQALHGFGTRITATVGEDRLLTWAAEVIAARRQGKVSDSNRVSLSRDEIPHFIHDLMGGLPERTRVDVFFKGDDPHVHVYNSAMNAFGITIRPSGVVHEPGPFPPHWLVQETAGLQWQPGIFLDTVGNFR